jgi:hypothetical protein
MTPKLVVVCEKAYGPTLGPTGYNGVWEGELAVQLEDRSVVKIGAKVSDIAISDYSNSSGRWCRVELYAAGSGWLVKIIGMWMEMGFGEGEDGRERWLGTADARIWRMLDPAEDVAEGAKLDSFDTPASDRTIYVSVSG